MVQQFVPFVLIDAIAAHRTSQATSQPGNQSARQPASQTTSMEVAFIESFSMKFELVLVPGWADVGSAL